MRASAGAALPAVRAGTVLAEMEQQLQAYVAGLEGRDTWLLAVAEGPLWALLFEQAFTARSNELVAARLAEIRAELEPLLARELRAMEDDAGVDGFVLSAAPADGVEQVLLAWKPQGYTADGPASEEVQPWDRQCNRLAGAFLTRLHAALADCARLVASGAGAGGQGSARAALLASSTRACASALASLLGTTAEGLRARLQNITSAELAAQPQQGGRGAMEGAAPRESCVEQALYVAQCASTVRRFLPTLLAVLPASSSSPDAAAAEAAIARELDEAGRVGYGVWVEWTALHVCGRFEAAMHTVAGSAGELKRLWEEVEVQVETESGEVKNEKVCVTLQLHTPRPYP